jgi:hypothetical protein
VPAALTASRAVPERHLRLVDREDVALSSLGVQWPALGDGSGQVAVGGSCLFFERRVEEPSTASLARLLPVLAG